MIREKFEASITADRFGSNGFEHSISISPNGAQWVGIPLMSLDEMELLACKMLDYVDHHKAKS